MESRSEHAPPEQHAWNTKYVAPPQAAVRSSDHDIISDERSKSAAMSEVTIANPTRAEVCRRVREQVYALLDDVEATMRTETQSALFGHLAVCPECTEEYAAMQRMFSLLKAMPLAEMPTDYSRKIMLRIQTGQSGARTTGNTRTASLCIRVREKLQSLIETDPDILPEMAAALHGHLMVCGECSKEYKQLQSMVNLLETIPTAELPMDYSRQIMRRIQAGIATNPIDTPVMAVAKRNVSLDPSYAVSSLLNGETANHSKLTATVALVGRTSNLHRSGSFQRFAAAISVAAITAYAMASGWGRQVLETNLEAVRTWFAQCNGVLERSPVAGAVLASIAAGLIGADRAIGHSVSAVGEVTAQTMAAETALILSLLLLISARTRTSPLNS